ncbi:MAG: hypothetical protein U1E94_01305 [Agitococcus sp.]
MNKTLLAVLVGLVSADVWAIDGMDPRSGTTTQDFGLVKPVKSEKLPVSLNVKGDNLDAMLKSLGAKNGFGIIDKLKESNLSPLSTSVGGGYQDAMTKLNDISLGEIKVEDYILAAVSANNYHDISNEISYVNDYIDKGYNKYSDRISSSDQYIILSSLKEPGKIKKDDFKTDKFDVIVDATVDALSDEKRIITTSAKAGLSIAKYMPQIEMIRVAISKVETTYNGIKAAREIKQIAEVGLIAMDLAELSGKMYDAFKSADVSEKNRILLEVFTDAGKIKLKLNEMQKNEKGDGPLKIATDVSTMMLGVDNIIKNYKAIQALSDLKNKSMINKSDAAEIQDYSSYEIIENALEVVSAATDALDTFGVPVAKEFSDAFGDSKNVYKGWTEIQKIAIEKQIGTNFKKIKLENAYAEAVTKKYIEAYSYFDIGLQPVFENNSRLTSQLKQILPSAPREPDPSLILNTTTNLVSNNSHMRSANPYMGNTPYYTSEDAVKGFKDSLIAVNGSVEKNTNTNPVQSGQQQSTFLNTQPFSSTDWIVKEGASNNFVKTESFGSVIAPNNKPMAALNNANASHTVMERTFTIPTGVKNVSLGFNANFITNEFPAFVGSQFNDNVKVEVITASGNSYDIKTPFKESLNASQLQPVTGLPNPMMADGGQTGFKPVDVTNIPVAGGGAVTVRVTVENVGDQLYPSAALISDTQAKPR